MNDLSARIERRWSVLLRYGAYPLLALSLALAVPLAQAVGTVDRLPLLAVLTVVAALAHWWCVSRRWQEPLDDWLGRTYVVARTGLAFVLSWLNPFFSIYASIGYYDAPVYLRKRATWAVLLVTAATMAGAQSGGLPPRSAGQAAAFAGLFVLNAGLVLLFTAISHNEAELAEERSTTIAALQEALRENAALQESLTARAREAGIHEERERLAAEIHDTIAQGLAGIVTQLQAAEDSPDDAAAAAHRKRAAELARTSLDEARRSVQALSPAALDHLDLVDAVRLRTGEWAAETGVGAEVVVTGTPAPVDPAAEAAVLRVVQESLTNVARHAAAKRVGVTLSYADSEVMLDVRDDGRGFDADAQRRDADSGYGIVGMRRRAERAGGTLVVETEPGGGTAVSLRVPSVSDD
ncbi:sensor histidine kinase [Mumia quercus]|uniref:sensor histidine kinase n=1 Tax=Mumia quercus TaxID=2976125 RepID=UPI0021D3D599|nr:sensor histidine kinase [Mumia quercus]